MFKRREQSFEVALDLSLEQFNALSKALVEAYWPLGFRMFAGQRISNATYVSLVSQNRRGEILYSFGEESPGKYKFKAILHKKAEGMEQFFQGLESFIVRSLIEIKERETSLPAPPQQGSVTMSGTAPCVDVKHDNNLTIKKGDIATAACDAHGALWNSRKQISPGDGYLLGSRFMQGSIIQDKLLDRDTHLMQSQGFTRERYRLQVESIQGVTPWLICDECIGILNLSRADKDAAKEAANKFWIDKNAPGHMPGVSETTRTIKPAYFVIFGNGFQPTEEQVKKLVVAWWFKRKAVFGEDAIIGVRSEVKSRPHATKSEVIEVVTEFQREHPALVIDDLVLLDRETGKDMVLIAVWPPEDAGYIQALLKSEREWK